MYVFTHAHTKTQFIFEHAIRRQVLEPNLCSLKQGKNIFYLLETFQILSKSASNSSDVFLTFGLLWLEELKKYLIVPSYSILKLHLNTRQYMLYQLGKNIFMVAR